MSEETVYKVQKDWKKHAFVDKDEYEKLYEKSVEKPDKFWGKQGERIDWIKPYSTSRTRSFAYPRRLDQMVRGRHAQRLGQLHRPPPEEARRPGRHHLGARRSRRAPSAHITYRELHREVNIFANVLKSIGVKRGDRVTIYLPMIPEAAYAMLACARIGAIHSVVFGGFSPDSLVGRITDCQVEACHHRR